MDTSFFSFNRLLKNAHLSRVSRDFAKLNLHLGIFEQPAKNHFFNNFLRKKIFNLFFLSCQELSQTE